MAGIVEYGLDSLPHTTRMRVYNAAFAAYNTKENVKDTLRPVPKRTAVLLTVGSVVGAVAVCGNAKVDQSSLVHGPPPSPGYADLIDDIPKSDAAFSPETSMNSLDTVHMSVQVPPVIRGPVPLPPPSVAPPAARADARPIDSKTTAKPAPEKELAPKELVALPDYIKLKPGNGITSEVEEYVKLANEGKADPALVNKISYSMAKRLKVRVPEWGLVEGTIDHRQMPVGFTVTLSQEEMLAIMNGG